jgi:putative sigma-54 modulation protein
MQIDIVHRNVCVTNEQKLWIDRRMHFALGRFTGRVRQASLVFSDINGARGGIDKKCRLFVTLCPVGEIVLEEMACNIEAAVSIIADRASRTLSRQLDRQKDQHGPRDQTIRVKTEAVS